MKAFLGLFLLLSTVNADTKDLNGFKEIIDAVNSLQTTWKADPDFPTHYTVSSIKKFLGVNKAFRVRPQRYNKDISDDPIPEEFDARKQWPECPTISQISDQGNCGSSWAVAASDAFSDRLCIASKGKITTPLSSGELMSCCAGCGDGCGGGVASDAWLYLMRQGIVTGGSYNSSTGCQPYPLPPCEHHTQGPLPQCSSLPAYDTPACEDNCTNPTYLPHFQEDHYKVLTVILFQDEEQIKRDIMTNGPVEAVISVYKDFPVYKSGVYQHIIGDEIGTHAVRVLGWGVDKGTPYWLLANSWNTHWGDQGLFKMIRGRNEGGIESGMVAGIPNLISYGFK